MTAKEYNQCVHKFSDGVYRFILKNLRDEDDARDIVQDAFVKMWEKAETIEFEKGKSYIFTAAYHTMIDFIRRNKRHVEFESQNISYESSDNSYNDLNEVLEMALEKLPEVQKNVILLRDYEGYSYEEIGQIVGLNESQVKVYIYRARLALKKFIGNLETVI
jgi:RNA polymerase sigma-70 factor (ECF subfamily)